MVDIVRRIAALGFKWFGSNRPAPSRPIAHPPVARPKVLVVGVYLAQKQNLADHLVATFGASRFCSVTQRWTAIGEISSSPAVAAVTVAAVGTRTPKFELINRCISAADVVHFDYIIVSDDDITVPGDFIDRFIGWQQYCDFALAQPARTWRSHVDHPFVRRKLFARARETRFVEIGPIFCMARSMAELLVPFDQRSAMGWGYDLVWPAIARRQGLRLGIVDDVAVDHSIRPRGQFYETGPEVEAMRALLATNEHISAEEAFSTLNHYR